MIVIISAVKCILKFIYAIMKRVLRTNDNKVLFLSRQSDELSLDFCLLKDELERISPGLSIVAICNRFDDSKKGVIGFVIGTLRSIYHLATCKVCVLDAYWPVVSMLTHKEELTVIQMWHALGKIKKSGYQTIGKESGRSEKISRLMDMHRNYDYVIAGGKAWNQYYCQSFDVTEDKLINI